LKKLYYTLTIMALVFLSTLAACCTIKQAPDDIWESRQETAIQITTDQSSCSSVHLGRGFLLSAAHCYHGTQLKAGDADLTVIKIDHEKDLILLYSAELARLSSAEFAASPAKVGSVVTIIGFPVHGFGDKIVSSGRVIAHKEFYLFVEDCAASGNSGGPAFDDEGKLTGIVSAVRVLRPSIGGTVQIRDMTVVVDLPALREFTKELF